MLIKQAPESNKACGIPAAAQDDWLGGMSRHGAMQGYRPCNTLLTFRLGIPNLSTALGCSIYWASGSGSYSAFDISPGASHWILERVSSPRHLSGLDLYLASHLCSWSLVSRCWVPACGTWKTMVDLVNFCGWEELHTSEGSCSFCWPVSFPCQLSPLWFASCWGTTGCTR